MKKKKILFIIPYPLEGASSRYRVHQYLPVLKQGGFSYTVSPFISHKFYKIIYSRGKIFRKVFYTLQGLFRRCFDVVRLPFYDLIFIHIESTPFSLPALECFAKLLGKPIIYDFDDAHFLKRKSSWFRIIFRSHRKTARIIHLSNHILVCNNYLREFSLKHAVRNKITVLPTPIDTDKFKGIERKNPVPVIGWIGSHSTFIYLEQILDVFEVLKEKFDFELKIVGAPKKISLMNVSVIQKKWCLEQELSDFQNLDIGVYPLGNSEWVRGKAAFKAIQYMAVQVPCVASNVGMNREVIQSGVNGFLVNTREEWIEKLSLLLESKAERQRLAENGRKTVEEHYSLKTLSPKFVQTLHHCF